MKRDIKFRAWDKANKSMKVVSELDFTYEKSQQLIWGMQGLLTDAWLNGECESYIPSNIILLQFTGLKDANIGHDKRNIYESDIIEWITDPMTGDKRCGVVRFKDGCFVVDTGITIFLSAVIGWGGVVVGNEFEHPELLEETND